MSTIFGILMLLIAVVAANVLHLLWPRLPLAIYQILAGIILALIPVQSHTFELDPKTFLLLIIAPYSLTTGREPPHANYRVTSNKRYQWRSP